MTLRGQAQDVQGFVGVERGPVGAGRKPGSGHVPPPERPERAHVLDGDLVPGQDEHAVLALEHAESVRVPGQLDRSRFGARDAVAVEIEAGRQPGVRRCDEAEGIGVVQVAPGECAVEAFAVVELVDRDDVGVHRPNDRRHPRNLRVVAAAKRRRELTGGAAAHRGVEGGEADRIGMRVTGEGRHDERGEDDGRRVHGVPAIVQGTEVSGEPRPATAARFLRAGRVAETGIAMNRAILPETARPRSGNIACAELGRSRTDDL